MPIALIVFGDKTHTDLHGTLAVTPLTFTLTRFNKSARNNTAFWRPLDDNFFIDVKNRHDGMEIGWKDNFEKFALLFFLLLLCTANSTSTNRTRNSIR